VAAIETLNTYMKTLLLEKKNKVHQSFWDASYDFKKNRESLILIVPIYHALNSNSSGESSLHPMIFFGLMDSSKET
jgi:hypothetical protein